MRRLQRCSATLLLTAGLLAPWGVLSADPFVERPIPLPWEDSRDVAVADFNNDGLPDIVALDSFGPHIFECNPPPAGIACGTDRMLLTVALNEGLGNFAPVRTTPSMCAPWSIVAADFNTDGRMDVMIANRGARDAFGVCFQASISYYPGDGNGGFFTPQHFMVPDEPIDMTVLDFDGDGIPETAVAYGTPGRVQLFSVSQGVFLSGAQWYSPESLVTIAAGDLDGDFDDELVAGLATGQVTILDSGVAGAPLPLETCTLPPRPSGPSSLVIGDFTDDLVPDIAVGQPGPSGSVVVLLRRGASGSYCAPGTAVTSTIPGGFGGHMAAADLNADAIPDLATTDGGWHLLTLMGNGTGHFAVSSLRATSGATDDIVSADLNGDWVDDLVVSGPQVFLATGAVLALLNDTPISDLMGLVMAGDGLDWNGVYDALAYDVVRGDIGTLRSSGGDFTLATEACVADNILSTNATLAADPPPGKAWFIIGRPIFSTGHGTYDEWGSSQVGVRDPEINASAAACP